jgi:broad specificity phosphatase PhoE
MRKPTKVLLVRHGETTSIANNRIHGQTDSPLSARGRAAAQKTAEYFRQQPPDLIYSSSLGRALETANMIGSAVGIQPIPIDGLREQYYGWLEGLPDSLFEPQGSGYWLFRPFVRFAMAYTAEKASKYQERILSNFDQIVNQHPGKQILFVVHWGVLCILERYLSGKDVNQWFQQVEWNYCGISEFHKDGQTWKMIRLDDNRHL